MPSAFFFYLDSPQRRVALDASCAAPGQHYLLYGANLLPRRGFTVRHNLEPGRIPTRGTVRAGWLCHHLSRVLTGSSGNFETVLMERRRCRDADIVVSTVDNVGLPLAYLNVLGMLRRPLLYISIGLPERMASCPSRHGRALYRALYRRIPRMACYGWEEALRLRAWLGLPDDSPRVAFIPFGVDTEVFRPAADTPPDVDIMSVGADMQRDFPLLMEAATRLPRYSFRLVTSTRHAASLGSIPANVTLVTNVPFSDIPAQIAACRLMAIPCRDNSYSGGTTTLLQAMAMAKPVVVSHTGAIREGYHLRDGINCRLAPPADPEAFVSAIRDLMNDPDQRFQMGAAARLTVEAHLTWRQYTDRLADTMLAMLNPTNGKDA